MLMIKRVVSDVVGPGRCRCRTIPLCCARQLHRAVINGLRLRLKFEPMREPLPTGAARRGTGAAGGRPRGGVGFERDARAGDAHPPRCAGFRLSRAARRAARWRSRRRRGAAAALRPRANWIQRSYGAPRAPALGTGDVLVEIDRYAGEARNELQARRATRLL